MERNETNLDEIISVPVTKPVKAIIAKLAEQDDRPVAQFVRRLLNPAIAEAAQKAGLGPEAKKAGLTPVSAA